MGRKVYGIDTAGKVTPKKARDAIVLCFRKAHRKILENMKGYTQIPSQKMLEVLKTKSVEYLIGSLLAEAGEDFENPSKQGLLHVVRRLAEISVDFRSKELVEEHYAELEQIIMRIE